ncbi:SRPBCC family protein [Pseudomonas sp. CDFA 602]|uniref:SRPBCC family protein n=1 Tax=Pseudomonas californiensis TaxID=2829823 RepID=UPI001E3538A7|nr:SRPBCC family protein [Pseudomonas californiensis]MCD5997308.1 SRPBCC family protein [Pseudomonas californiensis]MCD6002909.1 SRPBCC family protein [Pseudomonas californiensis]
MATVEYSAALQASAEQTWQVLRHFGDISQWHPAIAHSQIEEGQKADSLGAVRRLELVDGAVIRERLVSLDDTRMSLSYKFEESPLPLDNYQAHVTVIKVSSQAQCTVEWNARFDVRDPDTTAHFESLITELIVNGHNSLALYLAR